MSGSAEQSRGNSVDLSFLDALDLGPMSQEVLLGQDDLHLLTPSMFTLTKNENTIPDDGLDDGMDEVVATAGALLERWTEENDSKINIISNVVVREAPTPTVKPSSKLEKLLTMPRSSVTRNKNGFYSATASATARDKKKPKDFRFKVPETPVALPNDLFPDVDAAAAGPSTASKDVGGSTEGGRPTSSIIGCGSYRKVIKKQPVKKKTTAAAGKGLKRSFEDEGGSSVFSQEGDRMMANKFISKRVEWARQYRNSVSEVNRLETEIEEMKVRLTAAKNIRDRFKKKLDYFKLE